MPNPIPAATPGLPSVSTIAARQGARVMDLYRRFQDISAAAAAYEGDPDSDESPDDVLDRLFYDERDRIEDEMMAIPSVTAQDMAAKMLVAHRGGELTCLKFEDAPVWAEARALVEALATEDPIMPLFRQWRAARDEWLRVFDLPGNGSFDIPEVAAAIKREHAALYAMLDLTPISIAGIAALATVLWDLGGPSMDESQEGFAEASALPEQKLMLAIYRGASGESGLPPCGKAARPS